MQLFAGIINRQRAVTHLPCSRLRRRRDQESRRRIEVNSKGDRVIVLHPLRCSHIQLVGTAIVPLEDGELNHEGAVNYISCIGPDPEGRYEANIEYKIPNDDGTSDFVKSVSWFSEHGSYYAEDHINEEGRVVARRSGVYTPAEE